MNTADQSLAGRMFRIKVISNGGTFSYKHRCADVFTAAQHGMDLCGIGGRVFVEPVIQMTEGEGQARYPERLHNNAFADAWRGWHEAAQKDYMAIEMQVQRQGGL